MARSNKVEQILIDKQEYSPEEAHNLRLECKEAILDLVDAGSIDEVQDIIFFYLGLEEDYLEDILEG